MIGKETIPLSNILEFCTGADEVPPLGFDRKIKIKFFNQESGLCHFPYTSTCVLDMFLPRAVESFDEFQELVSQAVFHTCGFVKI